MSSEFQQPIIANITGVSQNIDITSPNSSISIIQVTGTWVGTMLVEGSNNGAIYYSIKTIDRSTNLLVASITANGSFESVTNGFQFLRVRSSAWTSGTATLSVYGSDSASLITTDSLLRGATNGTLIGNVADALKITGPVQDGGGSLTTDDGLSSGGVNGSLSLVIANTQYEAKVGVSRLSNRKSLVITALDDMYWGFSNTVTTATGTPLFKNQQIVFAINPDSNTFQVWLVASGASKSARITESP